MSNKANTEASKAKAAKAREAAKARAEMLRPTPAPADLTAARAALVKAAGSAAKADGVMSASGRAYAVGLNATLPAGWYRHEAATGRIQKEPVGNEAGAITAERKVLDDALAAIKYSNPSVLWGRIKKYAEDEAVKAIRAERIAAGESEEDVDADMNVGSDGKKEQRTPIQRIIDELGALWKANNAALKSDKTDADTRAKIAAAQQAVAAGLAAVGQTVNWVDTPEAYRPAKNKRG
jgi:hypothetical protein